MKKRIFAIFLAIMMLASTALLSACNGGTETPGGDPSADSSSSSGTSEGTGQGGSVEQTPGGDKENGKTVGLAVGQIIDGTKITDLVNYSEGFAFAEVSDNLSKAYCIDKQGVIQFTLNIHVALQISGFYNGISVFGGSTDSVYICNTEGVVTTPQDLGGDTILVYPELESRASNQLFRDGYFFVKRTTTTFTGSTDEAALFNSNLEMIRDFSTDLYGIYEEFLVAACFDGYLYESDVVFDASTGERITDLAALIETLQPEHPSDFWVSNDLCYYDLLGSKEEPVLDMTQYAETIYDYSDFEDGLAYMVFKSADTYFFTVLQENGEFCFEPIVLDGAAGASVRYSDGKFLVVTPQYVDGERFVNYIIFDETGKVTEYCDTSKEDYYTFDYSDGVVFINFYMKNITLIFDSNFGPLF